MANKTKVNIITADYSSKNKESLLSRCEKVRSDYDGVLHAGIIHYIQSKVSDFNLKYAIERVLDKCPSVWPEDLPEMIEKGEEPEITKEMEKEFKELNENLLIPVNGRDIAEIIKYAKQFLKEIKGRKKLTMSNILDKKL